MRLHLRLVASVVLTVMSFELTALAVDSDGATYFGGTAELYAGAKDPIDGILDTTNTEAFVFTATDKPFKGRALRIPYQSVIDLEYGQKAGRRVGAAVATTVLLGPIGLLSLFSKKRKHYLTVGYKGEDGKDQVAVIELGKDIVRLTLPILATRAGKEIEYQDDEARKSAGK